MMPRFLLPRKGWTYCPRCNDESMLAMDNSQYECPMCGLIMRIEFMDGQPVALSAMQPLHFTEVIRYSNYMMKLVHQANQSQQNVIETKMPWRVRLCFRIFNSIGWFFGCKAQVITDKRVKEISNEQT